MNELPLWVHRVLQPPGAFKSQKNNSCTPCVPMFKTARVAKNIWRIIKTIASIWGENMPGYLSLDIICSSKLAVSSSYTLENCSLLGTDNVQGQMHIFAPNGGYCLYIPWLLSHLKLLNFKISAIQFLIIWLLWRSRAFYRWRVFLRFSPISCFNIAALLAANVSSCLKHPCFPPLRALCTI